MAQWLTHTAQMGAARQSSPGAKTVSSARDWAWPPLG